MKIICFYTKDTPYEEEYKIFKKSLEEFNLDHYAYVVDSLGQWEKNCSLKSQILRKAIDEHDDNILYLDVDARIQRQPPFAEIEKDVPGYCVWHPRHMKKGQMCSGTIYFPNNELSRQVLDAWIAEQNKDLTVWDQDTLFKVYKQYNHFLLHHDWINIVGRDNQKHSTPLLGTDNPIILHTQASRRNKKKV
jgi:hypothetical protein